MGAKISIIIPVYNVSEYIERAVGSLLNQTYKNIEIILIDDGSKDGSSIICDNLGSQYDTIIVIHQANQGVSAARNAGLESCTGEYVMFLDADDWCQEKCIEKLLIPMLENDLDITCCQVREVTDSKIVITEESQDNVKILRNKEILPYMLRYDSGAVWAKLYRRSVIGKLRFEKDIRYGEDTLFLYSVWKNVNNIGLIEYCGYNYYCNRLGNVTSAGLNERYLDLLKVDKFIYSDAAQFGMEARRSAAVHITAAVRKIMKAALNTPDGENIDHNKYYAAIQSVINLAYKDMFLAEKAREVKIRILLWRLSVRIMRKFVI